jgi:hypothetical protein
MSIPQIFTSIDHASSGLVYLDPGSGSILLQMLLAALLGLGVAVRLFWGRIKNIFSRKSSTSEKSIEE